MRTLILLALAGFGAQLVDGALGMGYGVTSTTLLLIVGLSPAAASASVHLAEVGTTFVSGLSHWRFGNVDWRLVLRLGVPGALGAFLGATLLSQLSTEVAAPVMAWILIALGTFILVRFALRPLRASTVRRSPHRSRFLAPLGLTAGFIDATGGGGWGPMSTSSLLTAGRTAPRTVIGSVDTSEFMVTVAASIGFLIGLGSAGVNWLAVGGLLLGGIFAAPIAAWLVTKLPAAVLGAAVGGLIVLTNSRTVFGTLELGGVTLVTGYLIIVAAWAGLLAIAVRRSRAAAATSPMPSQPGGLVTSGADGLQQQRSAQDEMNATL